MTARQHLANSKVVRTPSLKSDGIRNLDQSADYF